MSLVASGVEGNEGLSAWEFRVSAVLEFDRLRDLGASVVHALGPDLRSISRYTSPYNMPKDSTVLSDIPRNPTGDGTSGVERFLHSVKYIREFGNVPELQIGIENT